MTAAPAPITIEQGATFTFTAQLGTLLVDVNGVPVLDANGNKQIATGRDFTGCTARAQIRQRYTSVTPILTVTSTDAVGGITLDSSGNVTMVIPASLTNLLTHSPCVWDMKVYNPSLTEDRIFEGVVTVDPAVTQDV